jgi:hypothetical protein
MFIWTIGDAIGLAVMAFAGLLFMIIWAQDWLAKRRREKARRSLGG